MLDEKKMNEFNKTPTFRNWENTSSGSQFLHKKFSISCNNENYSTIQHYKKAFNDPKWCEWGHTNLI